ncbi:NADPH-dependent ferric siderophore reductase [Xanthobacter sp. SG618]|uniref:siderophore-interacting protein n=1 Tax=Xanthobacter sp. SG618 TaxID=2587121 RepID=UPI00145F5FBF|nr:siderophore-interacting protein [Xanthobacter sp. SG618]NMN60413.1 NADPH-dependent ferric siderophore reductase [Xanthobacter sp. SG618]
MKQNNTPLAGAERPVPPERRLRIAEVRKVTEVSPHMRRITLASTALMDFPVRRPAQWVKVFVPTVDGGKPDGRAYTIRHFRETLCEMDIDFVLHGDGPCSTWAQNAAPGDVVQIAGPRGGFRLDPDVSHLLIGGDETALPAIGAILETLPAGLSVDAFVEIPEDRDAQIIHSKADVEITWLPRGNDDAGPFSTLADHVTRAEVPQASGAVWFAAEASVARNVRRHFRIDRAIPPSRLVMSGYWKKGETDFKDSEGDQ